MRSRPLAPDEKAKLGPLIVWLKRLPTDQQRKVAERAKQLRRERKRPA